VALPEAGTECPAPRPAPAAAPPVGVGDRAGAPRASVIIPHLNHPGRLALCLAAVRAQALDHGWFEVIVVDNGSHTPLDDVRAAYPEVRFLVESTPGPGPARNLGAAQARAPVLLFLDGDMCPAPGWLQAAVDAVEAAPGHPVGGDIRLAFANPKRATALEAYEAVFSFRQRRYIEKDGFAATGSLAVARDLFFRIGPFAGIEAPEDMLWGRRARALGHPVRFCPRMLAFHPPQTEMAGILARWRRLVPQRYDGHLRAGGSRLGWCLYALAVLASLPLHALKLLVSRRVPGLAGRLGGIAVLARVRWFRFAAMWRLSRAPAGPGPHGDVLSWNRSA